MIRFFTIVICCVLVIGSVSDLRARSEQGLLDRKVTLELSDVSLSTALAGIEAAAVVRFAFSSSRIELTHIVSVQAKGERLSSVLDALLGPLGIRYSAERGSDVILLSPIEARALPGEGSSLLLREELQALVSGVVRDAATQTPMAGVNVMVRGTTRGTTTDAEGRYSIEAGIGDVLVFSFIGYTSQQADVSGQTNIDIVMTADLVGLEEVVINAGYWSVTDRERTGNIGSISSKEIQRQPVSNPFQALQGRIPGVHIAQGSGMAGGSFSIEIRGRNSLRSEGNAPLYIVDGIPIPSVSLNAGTLSTSILRGGNPLVAIDPSDIESIEILKDADATAIYGSRGANGVVLITTKRGKAGATRLEATVSRGFGKVGRFLDLLTTEQHVTMRREALNNDGLWPTPADLHSQIPDLFYWDTTRYTNWQREFIGGTADMTNVRVAIAGGEKNTQFSLAGGYYGESTVFPGDHGFTRLSGSLNLNHRSDNDRFNTTVGVNYSGSMNDLIAQDLTRLALELAPNAPSVYDDDGNINWDWGNSIFQNPYTILNKKYVNVTDNLIVNSSLGYELLTAFYVKINAGYNHMVVSETSTNPLAAVPPHRRTPARTGASNFGKSYHKSWIIEPQVDYTRSLGQGMFRFTAGSTLQQAVHESTTLLGTGYTSDALVEDLRSASTIRISESSFSKYRYAALFGRLNYAWKEKYIVNLTGRRDGSSRFGPGRQFGNFGALGIAWIFSDEAFVKKHLGFINFGKLRFSYGTTGSDAIGNYQYLHSFTSTSFPYDGISGLVLTRLHNPDYSWETNTKLEGGIELGLLKDRLSLSISRYDNRSSNQLVGYPLPLMTGQSSIQYNLPATVVNTGWELQATSVNISRDKLRWTSTFHITFPRNTLKEFPNLDEFPAYRTQFQVGKSLYTRKTLRYTGVDPESGVYTFEDRDGDGYISMSNDGLFLKEAAQQFFGGLENSISIGAFDISFLFQFVKQAGYNYLYSYGVPGGFSNQPSLVTRRWQTPGDETDVQQYAIIGPGVDAFGNLKFSDRMISDASFVRLKNVSLSWNVSPSLLNKVRLQAARVFLQGQNLATLTDYLGMDPENQNVLYLPPLSVISFGTHLTF